MTNLSKAKTLFPLLTKSDNTEKQPEEIYKILVAKSISGDAIILHQSTSCKHIDLFLNGANFDDYVIDFEFPDEDGVYSLIINPEFSQDHVGDWDFDGITVLSCELVFSVDEGGKDETNHI